MYSYTPKPLHAILASLFCVVLLVVSTKTDSKYPWYAGAFFCGLLTVVIIWGLILETLNERVRVMSEFASTIYKLDDEARAMMAFEFPHLRYRMKGGEVREYFEDTNATIELFREFMKDSNSKYISPERNWGSTEKPRWAWVEIKNWLQENGHIIPDSAAGSHSWLWNGNAYQHLYAYWMAGRKIKNMNPEWSNA